MNGQAMAHGAHGGSGTMTTGAHAEGHGAHGGSAPEGLSLSAQGLVLGPVGAPAAVGEPGELVFRILGEDGEALTAFEQSHEKELHLIVVRTDGTGFRHVHPALDAGTGTWTAPWVWDAAGTYRVYADFAPAGADKVTLSRTVDVTGEFTPRAAMPAAASDVAGFQATVEGALVAGQASALTVRIHRDGQPVTTLEPYLGAFGHLVALREGDLAYLHVHAEGQAPSDGALSGPEIAFMAQAPTAGRYLLYLDFQVAGVVHTASFVLDAHPAAHAG
ncbi:hypothetical protein [Microbacterium resistens]|uniref:hypothetical protein n=1 Tax=Microbacterium resistens TaxID=156977 RepID=UPI001E5C602F|nr:hypothetical protein [Microbacterium resistens]